MTAKTNRRRFLSRAVRAFAGLGTTALWRKSVKSQTHADAGRTFYIDTAGSNSNDGASAAAPWRDFSRLVGLQLNGGDTVLLRRGCVWNHELRLQARGNVGSLVTVATYGEGGRPRIERSGWHTQRCVHLQNASHVRLSGIEVCHAGAGIVLFYDHSYNNRSVYLDDIVAHDFRSVPDHSRISANEIQPAAPSDRVSWPYAIGVTGVEDTANDQTRVLSDFRVTRTEVYNTGSGIALDWGNHTCADGTLALSNKFGDVHMEDLHLHDNTVEGVSFASLFLTSVTNCTIHNCKIERGARYASTGTAAVQVMYSRNVTLSQLTIAETPRSDCPDNAGLDLECNNDTVLVDSCTFTHNAGPAIEILATPGNTNPFTRNLTIQNCLFDKNNWARKLGRSQIVVPNWTEGNRPDGLIQGNRYRNAPDTNFFGGDGNTTHMMLKENSNVGPAEPEPTLIHRWDFMNTGQCLGWCDQVSGDVTGLHSTANGIEGAVRGPDPYLFSPAGVPIVLSSDLFLRIVLRNGTPATYAQMYFTTETDSRFDERKHRDFWLYSLASGFVTYDLEMAMPAWSGTLRQLRVDPEQGANSGTFAIRSIELLRR